MIPDTRDEFYVGYAPPMPPRLARFVERSATVAAATVVASAAMLATGHRPLTGGAFAFGERYAVSGVVVEHPYPVLLIDGAHAEAGTSMLLVAPGKHGAEALVRGLDGRQVSLEGARIQRGGRTMLEVIPDSLTRVETGEPVRSSADAATTSWDAREITLSGEVVDSKCFLGVMVPGAGKTHRECASLCLRGGIPPALFVRDAGGHERLWLLETEHGAPIGPLAATLAGTRVEITGLQGRRGSWTILRSDPRTWRRLPVAATLP